MADVQLHHGHLRIANSLDEAITIAPFSGTQQKIVRCVVRLTYGWNQLSVRMSRPDIAERCGLAPVGGFQRAFNELLRARVITELEEPFGRQPGVYALNKDFEHWGPFSVAAERLKALFNKRPQTGARPTLQGESNDGRQLTLEGESNPARPTLEGGHDSPNRVTHPHPIGSVITPEVVDANDVGRLERHRKTGKTEERKATRAHARGTAPHSLTLAEMLRDLPSGVREFARDFYADAPEDRQLDVVGQLYALHAGESVRDPQGQLLRAHTSGRLNAKCREVLAGPSPRDPDAAIVILFRKLSDSTDVSAERVQEEHREIQADERLGDVAARAAAEWERTHPDLARELRDELAREMSGDGPIVSQTREWAFISRAARLAEPVGTEQPGGPDDTRKAS